MEEFICPGNEVFPVRSVGVPAVVLTPRELPVQQWHIDRGHLRRVVILFDAEILHTQQPKHRLCRYRSHETALMIEPPGITLLGHAVTDEGGPRSAQSQ